jgi:hypothetical protein
VKNHQDLPQVALLVKVGPLHPGQAAPQVSQVDLDILVRVTLHMVGPLHQVDHLTIKDQVDTDLLMVVQGPMDLLVREELQDRVPHQIIRVPAQDTQDKVFLLMEALPPGAPHTALEDMGLLHLAVALLVAQAILV